MKFAMAGKCLFINNSFFIFSISTDIITTFPLNLYLIILTSKPNLLLKEPSTFSFTILSLLSSSKSLITIFSLLSSCSFSFTIFLTDSISILFNLMAGKWNIYLADVKWNDEITGLSFQYNFGCGRDECGAKGSIANGWHSTWGTNSSAGGYLLAIQFIFILYY